MAARQIYQSSRGSRLYLPACLPLRLRESCTLLVDRMAGLPTAWAWPGMAPLPLPCALITGSMCTNPSAWRGQVGPGGARRALH